MRHGFVKAAAVTPDIRVADCIFNGESIINSQNIFELKQRDLKI